MKESIQKVLNYLFPVTGGSAGAVIHVEATRSSVLMISVSQIVEVAFYAAIGAIVGYLVKKLLDRLFRRKNG